MANTHGTRWRGKLAIPEHAHPIVRRLIAEANQQETTMAEITQRAGLRRGAISQWTRTNHPRVDQVEAALNVLDLTLVVGRRRLPK